MDLYLVRHGCSTWNREKRVQGHQNPPLSSEGKAAVGRLAHYLQIQYGPFSPPRHVLVTSPLRRAFETSRILSMKLGVTVVRRPNLQEARLGEWEGRTVEEIRRTERRRLEQWYRDPTRVRLRGGESIPSFQKRVRREMYDLLYIYGEAEKLLIVTHGGWISTLLTDVVGIPLGRMWTFYAENSSLTRLHWNGEKLHLRSFNEASPNGRHSE